MSLPGFREHGRTNKVAIPTSSNIEPFHVTRIVENQELTKSDVQQSSAESAAKRGTVSIFRALSRAATTEQSLLGDTAIDHRDSTTVQQHHERHPATLFARVRSLQAGDKRDGTLLSCSQLGRHLHRLSLCPKRQAT